LPINESENFIPVLFDFLKHVDGLLNFADYVFLRRLNLAWLKCSIDKKISKKQIGCSVEITVPTRRLIIPETTELFNIAQIIKYGALNDGYAYLNFLDFAEVARYYYFFNEFEVPFNDGTVL